MCNINQQEYFNFYTRMSNSELQRSEKFYLKFCLLHISSSKLLKLGGKNFKF